MKYIWATLLLALPLFSRAESCGISNLKEQMLAEINKARASARRCGGRSFAAAPPLIWNEQLSTAASGHAEDMASYNYFSHTSRSGEDFSERISRAHYLWASIGENIAAGQPTVQAVMKTWLASPGHCKNIMAPQFRDVGFACTRDESSTYKIYWVQDFGSRR